MFGAQATEIVIKHQLDLIARYIENYYNELWFPEMIDEFLLYVGDCVNDDTDKILQ